jgi:Fe-S cluster assembly protein SufD
MTQVLEENVHLESFDRLQRQSAGNGQGWLEQLRRGAMDRFRETGFPEENEEEWRYTQIAPVVRTRFVPSAAAAISEADVDRFSFRSETAVELVFVNGRFSPERSRLADLPRGVRVRSLAEAMREESDLLQQHLGRHASADQNPFVALNTGFISDGAFVFVPKGAVIRRPIHLLYLSTVAGEPAVSHPRTIVIGEENVEATLVETYASSEKGVYLTNAVTEIVLGQNSRFDHCKVQLESLQAYHVATMQVQLARTAVFSSHSATIGGAVTRNDLNAALAGEGAQATLNGLVLIGGTQHCDNHTLLDHQQPHCPSHELYKHVLQDRASGVFRGKILVRPHAQKTDSKQTSRTLLLSDNAQMNSQPALEIYADDVKCTHGSTTGPLNEQMLFYLRQRGVGIEAAQHLLTYAFAADITRRIAVEPVRRRLEDYMAAQHGLPQDLRITDLGAHDEQHR